MRRDQADMADMADMAEASIRGKRGSEGGFTLIEILLVIVVLGVLATVVLMATGGITNKGESAAAASDARTLRSAEEAHFTKHGVYAKEAALVGYLIHTASSTHDVCVRASRKAYSIVAQGAACGPGFSK